ncbi:toxin-antitoxin system YwqK family antitoxin [Undibacterium sp. SXout7W]|uniref:toxin-antitoxin system YwqK family antitoxin n=1 Tax=Undibacterium sp. SXout7W TaxID=3413049 RepID=UPI003BF3E0BC
MKIHFHHQQVAAMVIMLSVLITGCSKKIDYREASNMRGLVYRANESTPFNGTIKNEPWGTSYPEPAIGSCSTEYKEGLKNGKMLCTSNTGIKMVESEWTDGNKDGTEKLWEVKTGRLWRETHYKNGHKDGLEEVHNPYEDVVIQKRYWANDAKSGSEKVWDFSGKNLLQDLEWIDGKQSGTAKHGEVDEIYKNGKLDGIKKTYDYPEDFDKKQAIYNFEKEARQNLEKLLGGSFFLGTQPGMVVSNVETFKDGLLQAKPENQACVDAKIAEFHAAKGINEAPWNSDIAQWDGECAKSKVAATTPTQTASGNAAADQKIQLCVDAKVAAFRKASGPDAPVIHDMQEEWEQECATGK